MSNPQTKLTILFVCAYIAIRIFSFYTRNIPTAGATVVFLSLAVFIFLYFKNRIRAWQFILVELLLGGAGIFFQLFGLSLRTWLLGLTMIFLIPKITKTFPKKNLLFILFLLSFIISSVLGLLNHNQPLSIIQDLIPFLFIIYIIPFQKIFATPNAESYLKSLASSYIIGSALFSTFTLYLFSSGLAILQNPFYKWFRDVAAGKITDMGGGFFRIVTPEHLLLTPILLILIHQLTQKDNNHFVIPTPASLSLRRASSAPIPSTYEFTRRSETEPGNDKTWVLLAIGLIPFAINFSRIYILALLVGLVVLRYKTSWKKWFLVTGGTLGIFLTMFVSANLLASNWQSNGLDLLGFRLSTLARPASEESSLSRLTLLQPIKKLILAHPIIGSGFGATITYISPRTKLPVTTSQFDWGYLEMWAEMGLIGAVLYLLIIGFMILKLIKNPDLVGIGGNVGLLAGVVSLLVINITAPALMHGLGIVFVTFILSYCFTIFAKIIITHS